MCYNCQEEMVLEEMVFRTAMNAKIERNIICRSSDGISSQILRYRSKTNFLPLA